MIPDQAKLIRLYDKVVFTGASIVRSPKPDEKYEHAYDNVPLRGFKIETTKRSISSTGGECVYVDPRGYTVHADYRAMSFVLPFMTIHNGIILNECVWGKAGSMHNMPIPVDTELYDYVLSIDNKIQTAKFKISDLEVGREYITRTGERFVYIGKKTEVSLYSRIKVTAKTCHVFAKVMPKGISNYAKPKSPSSFIDVGGYHPINPQEYNTAYKGPDTHPLILYGEGEFSITYSFSPCDPTTRGALWTNDSTTYVTKHGDALVLTDNGLTRLPAAQTPAGNTYLLNLHITIGGVEYQYYTHHPY